VRLRRVILVSAETLNSYLDCEGTGRSSLPPDRWGLVQQAPRAVTSCLPNNFLSDTDVAISNIAGYAAGYYDKILGAYSPQDNQLMAT
jgi:hypothetical protein